METRDINYKEALNRLKTEKTDARMEARNADHLSVENWNLSRVDALEDAIEILEDEVL
jgi:MFS superfamily sulfate permease-like transporter